MFETTRDPRMSPLLNHEISEHRLTLHWGDEVPLAAHFEGGDEAFREICALGTLLKLDMDSSEVTDHGFIAIGNLRNLEEISLQFTKVTGGAFEAIPACRSLTKLTANPEVDTRLAASAIGRMTTLRELDLEAGHWTNEELSEICRGLKLERLSISQFQAAPPTRALLPLAGSLRELVASESNLDDESCEFISQLPLLRTLSLSATNVTDIGITRLVQLTELRCLRLADVRMSSNSLEQFSNWRHLDELTIDDVPLGDQIVSAIKDLPQLRRLSAENCGISERGKIQLARSRNWEALYL